MRLTIAPAYLLLKVEIIRVIMQATRNREENLLVSLSRVKEMARRLLPINSTVRDVILAEKDVLPALEASGKFEVFDRLLCAELGS